MSKFRLTMTGKSPLLLHNSRLVDPLDPATQALAKLTSKRKKTEDDQIAIAEAEFMGSLYIDPDFGPYVPASMVAANLLEAAKLNKLGTRVKRGLIITTEVNPIAYHGPRKATEMFESGNYTHRAPVGVNGKRVMRTRPVFREWAIEVDGAIVESQLDMADLAQIADNAGAFIGIGDWRPYYGRFDAKIEEL